MMSRLIMGAMFLLGVMPVSAHPGYGAEGVGFPAAILVVAMILVVAVFLRRLLAKSG